MTRLISSSVNTGTHPAYILYRFYKEVDMLFTHMDNFIVEYWVITAANDESGVIFTRYRKKVVSHL